MSVPFSNARLRTPQGFRNALEGLSQEVLRSQPSDIFAFAALYFDKLVKIREETGYDPVMIDAHLEDEFCNENAFAKREVTAKQIAAAIMIQTKFRQYRAKRRVRLLKLHQAAVRIQSAWRTYKDKGRAKEARAARAAERKRMAMDDETEYERLHDIPLRGELADEPDFDIPKKLGVCRPGPETGMSKEDIKYIEMFMTGPTEDPSPTELDLDDPAVQEAAEKIAAGVKGMLVRADIRMNPDKYAVGGNKDEEEEEEEVDECDEDAASAKIQAMLNVYVQGFKASKVRKELK